jgi:dihydrofolate synthase / folylpolyglutamate synthase
MTYQQTLDYMYSQLPMFTRIGSDAIKKDLTNTLALCAVLDNPHQKFPTIHIGGTNGKGSTAHIIAAILQAAGYKTGLYISPHYKDFRERIKINGQYISKEYVRKFVNQNSIHFEKIKPSFFEMTVAMAFDYFHTEGVDIAVVEVGLGGRLDSTNIITPLLSIITNISLDHTDLLGNTIAEIAFEKAGIIKPHIPIVVGEEHPESKPVFEKTARERNAPIYFASQNIDIQTIRKDFNFIECSVNKNTLFEETFKKNIFDTIKTLKVNVSGDFQEKNIATVLQAIAVLNHYTDFKISEDILRKGLENVKTLTKFIGRWQLIEEKPVPILIDSAHNEGGIEWLIKQLKALTFNQLHIVFGMVKDKDISKILNLLPKNATYYFAKANIPRGLDAAILRGQAATYNLQGKAYSTVRKALSAAKKKAKDGDLIYVGGSIFVVAEVME